MAKGFWSDPTTEPKRQFRWVMNIGGIDQWLIKTTGKPEFEVGEAKHSYINHSFYYPGRVEWKEMSITLVDPVNPDSSATLMRILQESGYVFPLDPSNTTTISKAKAVAALGRVVIAQLGVEAGEIVEEWELTNAWIKSVKFGDLDYTSDEMTEIELTLRFDYASLEVSGPSVAPASF